MPTCARDRQYVTTAEQTKQCRITLIMQSADSARESLPCVGGRQGEAAAERAVVNDSPVVKRQAAAGGRCRLAAEVKK